MSRVKKSLNDDDYYKSYVMQCKLKGKKALTKKQYSKGLKVMAMALGDILLREGLVSLPLLNGDIFFKKKKRFHSNLLNLPLTRKINQRVYNLADETEGYDYPPYWHSPDRKNRKARRWRFSLYRNFVRKSRQLIKDKEVVYADFKQMIN